MATRGENKITVLPIKLAEYTYLQRKEKGTKEYTAHDYFVAEVQLDRGRG